MNLVLTLAIPTFDRADALERLLESLCVQTRIDEVQVLVSDNGSSDRTRQVLDGYETRLMLKRTAFEFNRGFDANYLNCVNTADGRWLWIMGDDDQLVPGAIDTVLSVLQSQAADLVVCNGGDIRDGVLVPRVVDRIGPLTNRDELLRPIGWHLCWIGTFIVRRSLYRPDALCARDFNAFIHLPLLVGALSGPFVGVFVPKVLLHTTVNHSGYFRDPRVLIETFGSRLHDTLACLGTDVRARDTAAHIVRGFHTRLSMFGLRDFIGFRADERFSFIEFARRLRLIRRLNAWAPLYAVLYLVPSVVPNALLGIVRRWRSNRRTRTRTA